jgi:MFS family permease
MTTPTETPMGAKAILAIPNFRNLWLGQTISQVGDGLTNLAVLIMINNLTGSTAAVATMAIALALPQLLFGLLAGVFVDRWDRKRIMLISDIARGALVLGFVLVQRPEDVWVFYVLGFLQAAIGTFFDPAKSSLIPTIVAREGLLTANALSQTTRVLTSVVGAALAGVLVGLAGNGWPAFTLDALTFFVSALFIARLALPRHEPTHIGGGVQATLHQLSEGLRLFITERALLAILIVFAVTMLGLGAVNVLFVSYLVNLIGVRTEMLGLIEAAQVAGMIVGSGLVTTLATRLKPNQLIVGGVCAVGVLIALIGAAPSLWGVLPGMFFVGLAITPVQASVSTLLQTLVPADKRGRASSAMNTVITTASVISMGAAGILGDMLGIREVFYLAGGIAVLAGLLAAALMRAPQVSVTPVVAAE